MAPGDAPIAARGLRREFGGVPVLNGVDLDVAAGEVVALLGSNGAGKTTLLRVLATLLRPTGGTLRLFGEDAARRPPASRRRLGYVGHDGGCYPDLTGRENLEFHAELHEVPDAAARVADLLRWAGLEDAARRPARTYSRGMAQRLALARVLLHAPELLLLDEPYSGLDPAAATRLDGLLCELPRAGHAIVLSTHDVERVTPFATRIVMLQRGRVARTERGGVDPMIVAAAYDDLQAGRA